MPGVYDALSARIAARTGFEAMFISGYGVSATHLGEPDFGLLTQTEQVGAAERICRTVACPVLVDVDTGYGNAINVMRTVEEIRRAGAAGIFLEDQVWPKRCGHMRGKRVIPTDEQVRKIRAAVRARGDRDCFIVARTDARQPLGLDEAITRALAYKDAGADALFVEAPQSVDELREIGRRLPPPLVANMVEGGATPLLDLESLGAMGYALVLYANAALRCAQRAVTGAYRELRATGSSAGLLDVMATWEERQAAVGKPAFDALEARYALP